MNLIAVYGTLKKGFGLHDHYLKDAEFVGPMKVDAVMHVRMGSYPIITHPEDFQNKELVTEHDVEVYRVSEEVFNRIKRMEESVGYNTEIIGTPYGPASMFWMPKDAIMSFDKWIPAFTAEEFGK